MGKYRQTSLPREDVEAGTAPGGDYPVFDSIDPVNLLRGRFLNELDIKEKRKIVVIGDRVRELLFEKNENPVNQYIQINGVYFKVVGLF